MKKYYFSCLLILIMGIVGFLIKGFAGGLLTATSANLLFFSILGKWLTKKATEKIDKNIHDQILNP